jgi:hypothetical protein
MLREIHSISIIHAACFLAESTRPHLPPSSSQLTAPSRPSFNNPLVGHGGGPPNPEESEYFYEEFVDYPQGASENNQQQPPVHTTQPPTPPPIVVPTTTASPQQSSHYIPGDTPTFYAGVIKNNSITPPPKVPGGDSPFTLFG